jgi:hypothetical protein
MCEKHNTRIYCRFQIRSWNWNWSIICRDIANFPSQVQKNLDFSKSRKIELVLVFGFGFGVLKNSNFGLSTGSGFQIFAKFRVLASGWVHFASLEFSPIFLFNPLAAKA